MPNGYWDRILHVDLTARTTWTEALGEAFWRRNLGGRALIAHYLLSGVPVGADPLSAENLLVFAAGVMTGTPFPGAGRHSVGAKSPLTGLFGESEAGGFWGAELRHAGWDGIVFHGRADRPVYLWINDASVEIKDAAHLWGRETGDVEDALRAELGDRLLRVAQCGIAAENGVRFALVVNDLNEVAGRTGLGTVMASKNLKAIAVRGKQKLPVADPAPLQQTAKWVTQTMEENHYNFHHYGTGAGIVGKHLAGHMIVRNFQDGQWDPELIEKIDAKTFKDTYVEKMDGCYACSVRCKKRVRDDAMGVLPKYGGPEYETIGAIGTNLTVSDAQIVMRLNQRLNQVGIDAVSFGGTVAWAMECFDRGLLTLEDTGGIELRWGDGATVLKLVDLVARREGPLGELLADGSLAAARKLGKGSEQYSVQIKGLEMAMHDPRGMKNMLENYPVTPTGGDHTGAGRHRTSLRNTVGLCQFLAYDEPKVVELVRAATGWDVDEQELRTVVSRGLSMARLFNLREGMRATDDRLPQRMHEPMLKGPLSEQRLSREDVQAIVNTYYLEQGWHPESGIPLAGTLAALGIADYAAYAGTVTPPASGAMLPPIVTGASVASVQPSE
ncbi:MAG TPA: aldehyde ferredoxin oxidoreductase family protein [Chloroflexota bacterium]|nr:aldehyde ferredoxin oxidoreductase family protein [Chloroflexota bacterium]